MKEISLLDLIVAAKKYDVSFTIEPAYRVGDISFLFLKNGYGMRRDVNMFEFHFDNPDRRTFVSQLFEAFLREFLNEVEEHEKQRAETIDYLMNDDNYFGGLDEGK